MSDGDLDLDGPLFDGVEDGVPRADGCGDPDADSSGSISNDDPVDVEQWYNHLTYDKVHSFTVGTGPALGIMAGAPELWPAMIAMYGMAIFATVGPFMQIPLSAEVKRYLCKHPHYFVGGTTTGWLTGGIMRYLELMPAGVL